MWFTAANTVAAHLCECKSVRVSNACAAPVHHGALVMDGWPRCIKIYQQGMIAGGCYFYVGKCNLVKSEMRKPTLKLWSLLLSIRCVVKSDDNDNKNNNNDSLRDLSQTTQINFFHIWEFFFVNLENLFFSRQFFKLIWNEVSITSAFTIFSHHMAHHTLWQEKRKRERASRGISEAEQIKRVCDSSHEAVLHHN